MYFKPPTVPTEIYAKALAALTRHTGTTVRERVDEHQKLLGVPPPDWKKLLHAFGADAAKDYLCNPNRGEDWRQDEYLCRIAQTIEDLQVALASQIEITNMERAAKERLEASARSATVPNATAFVKNADLSSQKTVDTLARDAARYRFRHSNHKDADGYEYGYCKVRWKSDGTVDSILWADDAEIDAAMAASGRADDTTEKP